MQWERWVLISCKTTDWAEQNRPFLSFLVSFLLESPLSGSVDGLARAILEIYDHVPWNIGHGRR